MENEIDINHADNLITNHYQIAFPGNEMHFHSAENRLPEILFITSYPPRECGIATYSQDLIKALNNKFDHSFKIKVCPLEPENEHYSYAEEVEYVLYTDSPDSYIKLAEKINASDDIRMVMIQHEFGFFQKNEA